MNGHGGFKLADAPRVAVDKLVCVGRRKPAIADDSSGLSPENQGLGLL